jgi:hypothetical protein
MGRSRGEGLNGALSDRGVTAKWLELQTLRTTTTGVPSLTLFARFTEPMAVWAGDH